MGDARRERSILARKVVTEKRSALGILGPVLLKAVKRVRSPWGAEAAAAEGISERGLFVKTVL